MIIIGVFLALMVLIMLGFPVLLALAIVGLVGIVFAPGASPAVFPQKMFTMLDSFSLLALPFFILAGELMAKGGISKRLVEFADTVVGHTRGGLGHAAVVSSMIFAGVSGSSVADTSAIGSILIPSMKERGYKPGFAASLLASAGTIGPIIPPSMTMIVYGSMARVSIGGLFLGGIIPGILIGMLLMMTIYIHSFFPQYPELRQTTGKFNVLKAIKAIPNVWVALVAPVIILGGILSGVFTATEAGAVACLYSFIVTFFIYRTVCVKDLPAIVLDAAVTTTMVVGIISVAGAISWLLNYLDFNVMVLDFIRSISDNRMVVLLILLATMLLMSMFVESLAVLIILVPVAVFVCKAFQFDPYQFGLLMVIATQIGAVTPPVAVLLFVATGIAKTTYDQTMRYCWPFIGALILVMLLVAFFPQLASFIPHYFLGR